MPTSPRLIWVLTALALLAVTLALRADTFFHPLILPTDEGLYYRMAVQWLEGIPLYAGSFDHKPPGIYYLFATAMAFGGKSMLAVRWAVVFFATWGAVAVYGLTQRLLAGGALATGATVVANPTAWARAAALAAALAYAGYATLLGGLTANTEIFFAPMLVSALWAAVAGAAGHGRRGAALLLLAGALGGAAFIVKYTVGLEALVVPALWAAWVRGGSRWPGLLSRPALLGAGLVALGFCLPIVGVLAHFGAEGRLEVLYHHTIAANLVHRAGGQGYKLLSYTFFYGQLVGAWALPLAAMAWVAVGGQKALAQPWRWLVLGWGAAATIGALFTGHPFDHYLLELLPALCVALGLLTAWLLQQMQPAMRAWLVTIIALPALAFAAWHSWDTLVEDAAITRRKGHLWANDPLAQLATYLRQHLREGEYFYAIEGNPTLYVLSGHDLPTRFVYWPMQVRPHYGRVTGLDQAAELERMLALKPKYMCAKTYPLLNERHPGGFALAPRLQQELNQNYTPTDTLGEWYIFKRKP